jgi:GT2 family glycosyltransferase
VLLEFAQQDKRVKVIFREINGHISAASNTALSLATGDFVALLDHDDELSPHALYWAAAEINKYPNAEIIYSDEDKIDLDGKRFDPFFKPDWNPELFFSQNYISHLTIVKAELANVAGGFRKGFEGSQDYDLLLRCIRKTEDDRIRHIPRILYHWRAVAGSTALRESEKEYTIDAGIKALSEFFSNITPGIYIEPGPWPTTYRVHYPVPEPAPKVSVIIPTRNGFNILSRCIESIFTKNTYPDYEIIIVDNQSDERETLEYFDKIKNERRIRIVRFDKQFNFSAINNYAVKQAHGGLICLMNNDIEVIEAGWLSEMVSYAVRPDVGAVGAKLLYPDDRVQHAGVITGLGGAAGHSHKFIARDDPGYFCRAILPQALSAVTAACLVVRKSVYEEVGGLDEDLAVAFNDVDFCMKVRAAGYRNVWTPYALLYHHESASRGYEDTPEKQERFSKEISMMKERWGNRLLSDPYYNPNLTLDREDFGIAARPRVDSPRTS